MALLRLIRHQVRRSSHFTHDLNSVCQEQNSETQASWGPLQNLGDSILPPLTKLDAFFFLVAVSCSNLDFFSLSSPPTLFIQLDLAFLGFSMPPQSLCLCTLNPPSCLPVPSHHLHLLFPLCANPDLTSFFTPYHLVPTSTAPNGICFPLEAGGMLVG